MDKGTLVGELCQRISEFSLEKKYTKPSRWLWAGLISAAVMAGSVSGYLTFRYAHDTELEKAHIQAAAEIEKTRLEVNNSFKKAAARIKGPNNKGIKKLKEDIKDLEAEIAQARKRSSDLESRLAHSKKDFTGYKKTHPEELTKEKYTALEKQLAECKREIADLKSNPGISKGKYLELKKQLDQTAERFSEYKKTHSSSDAEVSAYKNNHKHTNQEYNRVKKERDRLAEEKTEFKELLEKKFEDILVYRDRQSKELFAYFDITYEMFLPPDAVREDAGKWAGPKRVGRYITPEIAKKFDVWENLAGNYNGSMKDDFDRMWVMLEEKSGREVKYTLVIEKDSRKDTASVSEESIEQFIRACLTKR